MFSVYCLFIYFLFLCCKYRPFFPIFFYIIPTKICKILFFCKTPLYPLSLCPPFPPFPFSLSLIPNPSSLITPLSFGEGLGVRLPKKKGLQASSSFRCAYRLLTYIYIRNSNCYPFFISTNNLIIKSPFFPPPQV